MPKGKPLTPELRAARELKDRRNEWISAIIQLRFGSPTTPHIAPGNCQDFLYYLVAREWPFDTPAPEPRHDTHRLIWSRGYAKALFEMLPEWARETTRPPHSDKGKPIFMRAHGKTFYLDGRRRILKAYREDPNQFVKFWVIE